MNDERVRAYIEAASGRLAADGCEVRTEGWGASVVTIGYRSDFRLQWMATKLHLFTIMMAVPMVGQPDVDGFTEAVFNYVDQRKGQFRGLQSGIAAFPCLVSPHVDPAAVAWAQAKQRVRFALMARPVVVDVSTGTAACFRGTAALGFVYSAHLRKKLAAYFPAAPQTVAR